MSALDDIIINLGFQIIATSANDPTTQPEQRAKSETKALMRELVGNYEDIPEEFGADLTQSDIGELLARNDLRAEIRKAIDEL